MMEVGTEISQKIRSAIKAKLIELGAYVDDELPDYIMMMVANKKSEEQMVADLKLFLGSNTLSFAEWLHGLLRKLQTISVDAGSSTKTTKEKDKSESKKKEKVKKTKSVKSGKSKTSDGKGKTHSRSDASKKTVKLVEANDEINPPKSINIKGTESQTKANEESHSTPTEVEEDVRQLLVTAAPTDTDELAAELESTEATIQEAKTAKEVKSAEREKKKSPKITAPIRQKRSVSPRDSKVSSNVAKKHKGLSSVIANVSKDNEDEEEYDPLCPAVGSVASVVKVTGRKSKVPAAMQANSVSTENEAFQSADNPHTSSSDDPRTSSSSTVRLEDTASLERIRGVLIDILQQDKRDDISAFCQSIACSLRKMNQRNFAIAKLKIQKIIFDYESAVHSLATKAQSSNAATSLNSSAQDLSNSTSSISNVDSNSVPRLTKANCDSNSVSSYNQQSANSCDAQSSSSKPEACVSSSRNGLSSPATSHLSKLKPDSSPTLSEIDSSSSMLSRKSRGDAQPTTTSNSETTSSQAISLDSLHQKRRPEPDSANKGSVLKFSSPLQMTASLSQSSSGGSGCEVSGTNSPSLKPLSAEQLKVLAKNLKITISNSQAMKSASDSNSEESSSDDDSEDESETENDSDDETVETIQNSNEASDTVIDKRLSPVDNVHGCSPKQSQQNTTENMES